VLCLGPDGADYDLVRRLIDDGRLPTLAGWRSGACSDRWIRPAIPSRSTRVSNAKTRCLAVDLRRSLAAAMSADAIE